ncbi:hypothetical protein B0H10DRAFT_2233949 [Mycena sp. CBHHK59/15]|nr:hypothetical protein B0H10DRAFT_2233949 [Mycena sp. CBHHK59/15]
MSKRKHNLFVSTYELNDGSDSDDDEEDYTPRAVNRTHHVPHEHISVGVDGRTRRTHTMVPTPASPSKKSTLKLRPDVPPALPDSHNPGVPDPDFLNFDAEYGGGIEKGPRVARASDDPNALWVALDRSDFLDEFLRLEGRGDYQDQEICAGERCHNFRPQYRCKDCMSLCLYCQSCVVQAHRATPLHRIEEWRGKSFERRALKNLGLRIQLGHRAGEPCANPKKAAGDDFVVVDTHGIHEVGLYFCSCGRAQPPPIQLLRLRWYPATGTNPRSAATFRVLRRFHPLSLESKCSGYEFYNSLARETNNTGLEPSQDRYEKFMRMTRQWRNLQMLKRAGRGHDPNGIMSTKPGACALLCPACPQPGINLPPGWEKAPDERAFLYALFLALDANFRLKRKDVSSEEKDPGLGDGWSFYGAVKEYMAYLEKNWDQKQERSTCVAHDAVDKPDRESLGTASSGIGTVDCARHNMKRPNAVGDLQKGERYLNMNYLFFMSLAGSTVKHLYVSYDIACQWHKNIWQRMQLFDLDDVQFKNGDKFVVFLVPKFHLPAHIEACNLLFSFNLTPNVGRTDGEAPERGWANANPLANSTKESGPGTRRDILNDFFNDANYKKIVALGRVLLEKIQTAIPEMLDTRVALEDMERSFGREVVMAWTAMALLWESDASKPNPFASTVKHEGLQDIRRRLAAVAAADTTDDRLEEQQRSLALHVAAVGSHETVDQERRRVERETKLRRKVVAWMDVELQFIPHVAQLRALDDAARARAAATQASPGIRAHEMKLWLPSAIANKAPCDRQLYEYEYMLRKGQAHEALEEIRNQLLVRTHEYKWKDTSVRGVKALTRSQGRIEAIDRKIQRAAEQYRAARAALVSLGSMLERTEWQAHLKPLHADEIRGMPRALFADPTRKKRKKRRTNHGDEDSAHDEARAMSWIWITQAATEREQPQDVKMNEVGEDQGTGKRWHEEVDLLEEEMRRVLQFLTWQSGWWLEQVGRRDEIEGNAIMREGHAAYAHRQSAQQEALCQRFRDMWEDVPAFIALGRAQLGSLPAEEADDGDESSDTSDEDDG